MSVEEGVERGKGKPAGASWAGPGHTTGTGHPIEAPLATEPAEMEPRAQAPEIKMPK